MELFRFIAWQWDRFNYEEVTISLGIVAMVVAIVCCATYGISAGWAFLICMAVFFGTCALSGVFWSMRNQWRKYKQFREREAQEIIDRLAGRRH